MRQARRLLASAAVVASILGAELPAQEPFWIQPFQAPPSSFEEVLASVQFAAIYGNGIRFDLFVLGPEFFQGAAPLTTPTLWSETVASLQGELVTLPIGLGFAPGTFLGLGLTLPSDLTGVRLNSHDLCVNVMPPCESILELCLSWFCELSSRTVCITPLAHSKWCCSRPPGMRPQR
jgi:hypothetical protein